MKIQGSEAIIKCLIEEGVDTIYGYPGGAIMPVYDSLYSYQDQINQIKDDEKDLRDKIIKFREDELHHKDIAYEKGASKEGFYSILDKVIKTGSKIAINISEKI